MYILSFSIYIYVSLEELYICLLEGRGGGNGFIIGLRTGGIQIGKGIIYTKKLVF